MKRFFCVLLCTAVLCTSFVHAAASESSLDEEIAIKLAAVKNRIPNTELYDSFSGNKITSESGNTYRFTWETDDSESYKRLYVVLNDEDVITNYSQNEESIYYNDKPTVNKMPSDKAVAHAESLVYKLNPMLEGKVVILPPKYDDLYSDEYNFTLQRIENGIEVYGDDGTVTISADCTKINRFYMNYTVGLKFEEGVNFISSQDAEKAYADKLGLELRYEMEYTPERTKEVRLRYVPSEDFKTYIDAVNGEVVSIREYYEYADAGAKNEAALGAAQRSTADSAEFSKAETEELDKLSNLMTANEAESAVRANGVLQIPDECTLTSSYVSRDYYDKNQYDYHLYFEGPDYKTSCSVTCDAKTGEITDYYRYGKTQQEDIITDEEARKIGEDAVKKLASAYFTDDNKNTYILEESKNGSLLYRRYVNGVACTFNTISVSVDKADSSITAYSIDYDEAQFTEPSMALDRQEIHDILFDEYEYKVVYMPSVADAETHKYNVIPVYAFSESYRSFDALEGKKTASYEENIADYEDISGHYAADAINTLKRFGIGFSGGKFEPDRTITQGEYLALLDTIFDYGYTPIVLKEGYDYTEAYNYGFRNHIITTDKKDYEAPLTREMACIMLIKAMGYDEIASLDGIYVSKFADVNSGNGYIPILAAMGVVNGAGNGRFEPEAQLTRADAIIMLYNYLSK